MLVRFLPLSVLQMKVREVKAGTLLTFPSLQIMIFQTDKTKLVLDLCSGAGRMAVYRLHVSCSQLHCLLRSLVEEIKTLMVRLGGS